METVPSPRFRFSRAPEDFYADDPDWSTRIATLDGGGAIAVPIYGRFSFEHIQASVDIHVDVEDGRAAIQRLRVNRVAGGPPLEFVLRDLFRGVQPRDLLAEAVLYQAMEPIPGERDKYHMGVRTVGTMQSVLKGVQARRLPMSDERLRLTADAFGTGGINAVMNIPGWETAERQARRAVAKARERGFLAEGD